MDQTRMHRAAFTKKANVLDRLFSANVIDFQQIEEIWELFEANYDELSVADAKIYEALLAEDESEEVLTTELEACEVYKKRFIELKRKHRQISSQDEAKLIAADSVSDTPILSKYHEKERKTLPPKKEIGKQPKDPYLLVQACCFFVGFLNIMPTLFFSTAAGYWMYKFRDPALGDRTVGKDRTALQIYFQPCSAVASLVPSLSANFILTFFGHKWSAMKRTVWSLTFLTAVFITFVVFTQVKTESWQTGFFVLTMCLLTINVALTATLTMSSSVLIAKLPNRYMFTFLLGQNGTFFTTILQIISLSVTDSQSTSGFIYFSCGSTLIALTLLLLVITRRSKIFKYYKVKDAREHNSEDLNWKEFKIVIKKIWPCQVLLGLVMFTLNSVHPSITTLVVSQNDASETEWTRKYFTPVGFFLVFDISCLLGRMTSFKVRLTHSNKWWFFSYNILLLCICAPFYIFCNAQTRTLPVYFDKDWEFISFNAFFGFSFGLLINICFLSVKNLAGDNQEAALKLMTLTSTICGAATVANGLITVKLLNIVDL